MKRFTDLARLESEISLLKITEYRHRHRHHHHLYYYYLIIFRINI